MKASFGLCVRSALPVLLLFSCQSPDEDSEVSAPASQILDVSIRESEAPSWGPGEGWVIPEEPFQRIGAVDGPSPYALANVWYAIRLPSGGVAVGERVPPEIRFFDEEGQWIQTLGRKGEGPGEFSDVGRLFLEGDSALAVTDGIAHRLVRFRLPAGEHLTTEVVRNPDGTRAPNIVGRLKDGRWIGVQSAGGIPQTAIQGTLSIPLEFYIFHLGDEPRLLFTGTDAPRWSPSFPTGGTRSPYVPLAARPVYRVGREKIYFASGEKAEVEVFGSDGGREFILRWPAPVQRITNSDQETWLAAYTERMDPGLATAWRRSLPEIPFPETHPVIDELIEDREGNLWVRNARPTPEGSMWEVFDSQGLWLGSVLVPRGLRVSEISSDMIIGVAHDALDVPQVQVYHIQKQGTR